jgi:hypothetical protein
VSFQFLVFSFQPFDFGRAAASEESVSC